MSDLQIRPEQPRDVAAVRRTNELAFGRAGEADLVDALRSNGAITLSLIAELEGELVGHVLFSPVEVDRDGACETIIGLAPLAVLPLQQRRGVGSALVRAGIDRLTSSGHRGIIVLGHPEYYPRFGFTRASGFGLRWEHECSDEAFMALELQPGALGSRPGVVRYRREFGAV